MTRPRPTRTLLALSLLAIALPAFADDSWEAVERFLGRADMTFTQSEADDLTGWIVTTPDGDVFTLSEGAGRYRLDFPESRPITPRSGDWTRIFTPTHIDCLSDPRQEAGIMEALASAERIANMATGSSDGGATTRYAFSAPFDADQLLEPILDLLFYVEITSSVDYGSLGSNLFEVTGVLSQPSDFDIHFEMTLGVVSENLIMGSWSGTSDPGRYDACTARGLVEWSRQGVSRQ